MILGLQQKKLSLEEVFRALTQNAPDAAEGEVLMNGVPQCGAIKAIARRTFRQMVESPIAYVVGIFFYGFVGSIIGGQYFLGNQAELAPVANVAPWVLWFAAL